uniref:RxLR effector candidate protein n=1 Tax=Hyaloperonospora arabidopsidis (strain Emoy2) TaxID=559515 RepID=M4BL16_HYAAE
MSGWNILGCNAAAIFSAGACDAFSACNDIDFCYEVGFLFRLSFSACSNSDGKRFVPRWWVFGLPRRRSSAGSRIIEKVSSMMVSMLRTLLTLDKCHLDSKWSTDSGIFC